MNWLRFSNPSTSLPDLGLTRVIENGIRFETCVPVTFRYVRNTEKSPYFGACYGQDIEPAGRYVIHNEDPGTLPRGWETGSLSFSCPLVLDLGPTDAVYGPEGWKARLHRVFKSKGAALTRKLRARGFDGIVTTHGGYETREIVAL